MIVEVKTFVIGRIDTDAQNEGMKIRSYTKLGN